MRDLSFEVKNFLVSVYAVPLTQKQLADQVLEWKLLFLMKNEIQVSLLKQSKWDSKVVMSYN